MRKAVKYLFSSLLLAAVAGYAGWTQYRPESLFLSDLRSEVALDLGVPGERGNLLGIQPELFANDYRSAEQLRLKLSAYLDKARSAGLLNGKTIVVLPEHVGTWLVASGEKNQVYSAASVSEAMAWLAASNPLQLLRALPSAKGADRLADALFRMKAAQMAADYQALFGGLAKAYGITLVAGSIVLPEPRVENGVLLPGDGPLYNVSLVFAADGQPLGQPQRKVAPIVDEQGFTAAAPASALQVVDTPAGRLGVLICADSWFPQTYQALAGQQVELLAVPAFLTGNGGWDKPWRGYNGLPTPADVRLKAGELTEGDAWQRMAMAGRIGQSGARAGITVFMRGQLWDLGSAGHSLVADQTQHVLAADESGARLINLWL
ncbi:nitrilase-related carbon-nitrogen hydrolase [Pseudomonas sp. N040]|uniref:nitrilase-related carbon-nitrogen hydrolase n=1 Tax=Pseudomonas sp. N040 TaxID=2785325 RepID=UPI0018A259CB|nr:nitrilase-related carbon-nitrogen hydrolase [Pseudomonas sp. N040]MBF7729293.1 carbon-nitrogen hydrolase family protein [Pseudomonas sp. N040]MBW7012933.1 carbon-nitrogen hydrolase family protein [Pseudomonas sp. N040]